MRQFFKCSCTARTANSVHTYKARLIVVRALVVAVTKSPLLFVMVRACFTKMSSNVRQIEEKISNMLLRKIYDHNRCNNDNVDDDGANVDDDDENEDDFNGNGGALTEA